MLTKDYLNNLQQKQGQALVSILAPMERVFPASDKNPILMKNLIKETNQKLSSNYDPVRAKSLMEKIEGLETGIDYTQTGEGIALFVSDDTADVVHLPFAPREQVVVGTSFQTRDLLMAYHKTPQYLLLSVTLEHVRLFRGFGKKLEEIKNDHFPAAYAGPARTEPLSKITRQDIDYEELEDVKIFLRSVDDNLFELVREGKTPLFIVGEKEYISFFKTQNKSGKYIAGEKAENYAHRGPSEIVEELYPIVMEHMGREKQKQLDLLQESVGYGRYAKGIDDVWKAAKLGQVLTLFVEENFSCSARVKTSNELELELYEEESALRANWHHDIVDDVIELVQQMDGSVFFAEDGQLKNNNHKGIAAILRYSL